MSDKFNLNFTDEEHNLYLQMKALPNPSKIIKDLLKVYFKNPVKAEPKEESIDFSKIGTIIGTFVGDDVVAYGSQDEFNRNVSDKFQ